VHDYQEVFWGDRGPSRREERLALLSDRAIAVLKPLLQPGETLSILLADIAWGWTAKGTIVISGQRVFVVRWDHGQRTMIAERGSVSAWVKVRDEGGDTVRISAPSWGTIEVRGREVSGKAHEVAGLLNDRSSRRDEPGQGSE
jgi:hypothetical protein